MAYWAAAQGLTAFLAAHGLQGLQAFWAAHGLHGLQAFWAAQGLQGLAAFGTAQGLLDAATRIAVSAFDGCDFFMASGLARVEVTVGAAGSCAIVAAAATPPVANTIAIGNNAAVESKFCRIENM